VVEGSTYCKKMANDVQEMQVLQQMLHFFWACMHLTLYKNERPHNKLQKVYVFQLHSKTITAS